MIPRKVHMSHTTNFKGYFSLKVNGTSICKKRYGHLIKSVKSRTRKSFLIIDDTVIAKPYSKELDILSWIYSSGDKQYLYGINVVFIIWTDGKTRYPLGFRIWNKNDNKTKIDLAIELLLEAKGDIT